MINVLVPLPTVRKSVKIATDNVLRYPSISPVFGHTNHDRVRHNRQRHIFISVRYHACQGGRNKRCKLAELG